jgi:hypothetical protein
MRGGTAHLGEELCFLRGLVLNGEWDAAEAFVAPAETLEVRGVIHGHPNRLSVKFRSVI